MGNGYTKLFGSIITSTIWQEDSETKVVWITLLALVEDCTGFVSATIPGLANIAGVPIDKTRSAMAKFQEPDPDSRSQEYEGKRIAKADGGWIILNYAEYRKVRDPEKRKEYMRKYMQEYRAADNSVNDSVNNVNSGKPQLAQADAEASAEASAEAVPKAESAKKSRGRSSSCSSSRFGCSGNVGPDQDEAEGKKTTKTKTTKKTKTTSTTNDIIQAFKKLPLPAKIKAVNVWELPGIEKAISELKANLDETMKIVTEDMIFEDIIIKAIANYKEALELEDTQAGEHDLLYFLQYDIMKYTEWEFNIDNFDSINFPSDQKLPNGKRRRHY